MSLYRNWPGTAKLPYSYVQDPECMFILNGFWVPFGRIADPAKQLRNKDNPELFRLADHNLSDFRERLSPAYPEGSRKGPGIKAVLKAATGKIPGENLLNF